MIPKRDTFKTPFEDHKALNGQHFEIIGWIRPDEAEEQEEMFTILLPEGEVIDAYPEEVFEVDFVTE